MAAAANDIDEPIEFEDAKEEKYLAMTPVNKPILVRRKPTRLYKQPNPRYQRGR
jgi:hypothetical protein